MIESQTKLPLSEPVAAAVPVKDKSVIALLRRQIAALLQVPPNNGEARPSSHLANAVTVSRHSLAVLRSAWQRLGAADAEGKSVLNRYALHLVVILLAFGVVIIGRVQMPQIDLLVPRSALAADLEEPTVLAEEAIDYPISNRPSNLSVRNPAIVWANTVPHTTIPDRYRMAVVTYTVQPRDTVWGIAQAFGIEVETIMWANSEVEQDPDLLSVGQVLTILPVNGVYYTVKKGDTVDKLAKTYKTTKEKIVSLELNALAEPYTLAAGQKLILPDGKKPLPTPRKPLDFGPLQFVGVAPKGAPQGSGKFMWPTRGYWERGLSKYHKGADIANSIGTPIYAADAGYVMLAGRDTWGYGLQVVINHGNGFHTRYAHLSKILVKAGQFVKRGEKIALMGSTGRSTGPHLHFEIIKNGVCVNPAAYLPH